MNNALVAIIVIGVAGLALRRGVPGWLCSQGFVRQDRGDYTGAERWFLKALSFEKQIQRLTGKRRGVAIVLSNLGLLYHQERRMEEAVSMFTHAIAIYSDQGLRQESAPALASLGKLEFDRGNLTQAADAINKALELYQRRPNAEKAIAKATALLDLITERGHRSQSATTYTHKAYGFTFTIPDGWVKQRLLDGFSSTGGEVAISHASHRATFNVSVGRPERPEWRDKDIRATEVLEHLGRSAGRVGPIQVNANARVGREPNTVSAEYDAEASVGGTARQRRHGLISIVHNGLEFAIQWSAEHDLEDQVRRIVTSFAFTR